MKPEHKAAFEVYVKTPEGKADEKKFGRSHLEKEWEKFMTEQDKILSAPPAGSLNDLALLPQEPASNYATDPMTINGPGSYRVR